MTMQMVVVFEGLQQLRLDDSTVPKEKLLPQGSQQQTLRAKTVLLLQSYKDFVMRNSFQSRLIILILPTLFFSTLYVYFGTMF